MESIWNFGWPDHTLSPSIREPVYSYAVAVHTGAVAFVLAIVVLVWDISAGANETP
jgi:hypothetical protein